MLRIVGLLRIHPLILVLLVLFTAVFKKDKNYKNTRQNTSSN